MVGVGHELPSSSIKDLCRVVGYRQGAGQIDFPCPSVCTISLPQAPAAKSAELRPVARASVTCWRQKGLPPEVGALWG